MIKKQKTIYESLNSITNLHEAPAFNLHFESQQGSLPCRVTIPPSQSSPNSILELPQNDALLSLKQVGDLNFNTSLIEITLHGENF